jgi:hypothetical protein
MGVEICLNQTGDYLELRQHMDEFDVEANVNQLASVHLKF